MVILILTVLLSLLPQDKQKADGAISPEEFIKIAREYRESDLAEIKQEFELLKKQPRSPQKQQKIKDLQKRESRLEKAHPMDVIDYLRSPPKTGSIGKLNPAGITIKQVIDDKTMMIENTFPLGGGAQKLLMRGVSTNGMSPTLSPGCRALLCCRSVDKQRDQATLEQTGTTQRMALSVTVLPTDDEHGELPEVAEKLNDRLALQS